MIEERLLDTKRNLEKLADETGMSLEEILKLLSEGNQSFGEEKMSSDKTEEIQPFSSPSELIRRTSRKLFVEPESKDQHLENQRKEDTQKTDGFSILLEKSIDLVEESILELNRTSIKIMQNVVDQMVTKKIYKIRQSFRQLILSVLGVNELAFYVSHESGRIQFQDFASNYITQVMDSDMKCSLLQRIINSAPTQLCFVDLADNSDLIKLFDLTSVERGKYYGMTVSKGCTDEEENLSYCLMIKVQSLKNSQLSEILTQKLIGKIIDISQISTPEDSIYVISKIYTKKMLDLLEILIILYDSRLKKSLCGLCKLQKEIYYSLTNISKIILSKIDQNLANQQVFIHFRKLTSQFEEMQYKKIEQIRMYKKYVRQNNVILLEFNRVGILLFISGNRNDPYLNDLSRVWEQGKPVLDLLFGKNEKFQNYIKKAVRGSLKTERPLQIANQVKAKITTNGKRIQKIQITIEDSQAVSSNSKQSVRLQLRNDNVNSTHKTLHKLEKQNPGISKEGWLDLFIKRNQNQKPRRRDSSISRKKNNTYAPKQISPLKSNRHVSCISLKQQFKVNIEDIAIDNPNINFLTFSELQLESFAIKVLDNLSYFQNLRQERTKLLKFIRELHDNYQTHQNPFHNFKHGINVMHTAYLLSTMPANFNILTVKDIFVNVFSGLCHDVGHTGFTNAFQVASLSKKALIYNDKSPLQNFHASTTFQLLRKEQNNFLCHMERQQFITFRKAVIENILYTDIKQHFPLLNTFNELLKSGKVLGREDAPILSYMIVHSSDFAGSVKEFQICKEWSRRVNLEFSNQYKIQGEIGIPQTPFMKDLKNPVVWSKAEGGFLKVIVYPLYQALDTLYITEGIAHKLKKNIQDNIKAWQQMNKLETQKVKFLIEEATQ